MKLGIKTTGGVSKLKTKTTDGVAKAVECACCNPCGGLWGPGYDDWPDTILLGCRPIGRISKCEWVVNQCYTGEWPFIWSAGPCPSGTSEASTPVIRLMRGFYTSWYYGTDMTDNSGTGAIVSPFPEWSLEMNPGYYIPGECPIHQYTSRYYKIADPSVPSSPYGVYLRETFPFLPMGEPPDSITLSPP